MHCIGWSVSIFYQNRSVARLFVFLRLVHLLLLPWNIYLCSICHVCMDGFARWVMWWKRQKIISDILINFMLPRRPVKSFMWQTRKDQCWVMVPLAHILSHVTPPSTTSSGSRRRYKLEHAEITNILHSFDKFEELSVEILTVYPDIINKKKRCDAVFLSENHNSDFLNVQ